MDHPCVHAREEALQSCAISEARDVTAAVHIEYTERVSAPLAQLAQPLVRQIHNAKHRKKAELLERGEDRQRSICELRCPGEAEMH